MGNKTKKKIGAFYNAIKIRIIFSEQTVVNKVTIRDTKETENLFSIVSLYTGIQSWFEITQISGRLAEGMEAKLGWKLEKGLNGKLHSTEKEANYNDIFAQLKLLTRGRGKAIKQTSVKDQQEVHSQLVPLKTSSHFSIYWLPKHKNQLIPSDHPVIAITIHVFRTQWQINEVAHL